MDATSPALSAVRLLLRNAAVPEGEGDGPSSRRERRRAANFTREFRALGSREAAAHGARREAVAHGARLFASLVLLGHRWDLATWLPGYLAVGWGGERRRPGLADDFSQLLDLYAASIELPQGPLAPLQRLLRAFARVGRA